MRLFILGLLACLSVNSAYTQQLSLEQRNTEAIRPAEANPWYWSYKGEPVLLLGGSDEDNLFNKPDLMMENFAAMERCGANYIRSTLSSRDDGNIWPYEQNEDGLFDLTRFNREYWTRLERSIQEAYKRDIIVQIEFWATFDHYREYWLKHPFNPKNNINISSSSTGMLPEWDFHPASKRNPFFFSFPEMNNETQLLGFQEAFVKKALDASLPYPNVLYCIDNETRAPEGWSLYWGRFARDYANEKGCSIQLTEMSDNWNITTEEHERTWKNPDVFSFMEVSQNNWQEGQTHYDRLMWMRETLASHDGGPRPMSNIKVYHRLGGGRPNDPAVGIHRWLRNVWAGCASTRFHRPDSGLGLAPDAQTLIGGMRTFLGDFDIFASSPAPDSLAEAEDDEAYCLAVEEKEYAVYFPKGGDVTLKTPAGASSGALRWFDPSAGQWLPSQPAAIENSGIRLAPPDDRTWFVLVNCR